MKLNIATKVNGLIIIALILVGGASLLLSVSSLKSQGELAIKTYRSGVMDEKKAQIKDLVDSAYTIAKERLDASCDKKKIRKEYGDTVKAAVDQAISVFESAHEDGWTGSLENPKEHAIKIIEKMRWGDDGKGYFWIQDTEGRMILHPIKPSLNGKPLLELKDPDGKLLFKEMDTIAKKNGAGFVDYKWPKPGFDAPVDKISYVKLFKPWGWIIGGGVYLESTEKLLKECALNSIGSIRYGGNKEGYFFIYDSRGTCLLYPAKPENQGKNYYDLKDKKGNYLVRDIIKAAAGNDAGGFFKYYFPKPGSDEALPKLSFARKLKPWDWNIGTGVYTDDVEKVISNVSKTIKDKISQAIFKITSVTVAIILVSLIISYLVIAKGVAAPIGNIVLMLKDIAEGEGDLTKRIENKTNDETRELAEWFNRFIANIQDMISKINNDAITLTESSKTLADISELMNRSAQNTSDRSNTVSAAAEEMSANVDSMAAAMEEASTNTSMVSSAAVQMSSTIGEISTNTEKAKCIADNAVNQAKSASAQVNELGTAAKEIFNVVESITEISEQVNLLALNATIEAASAGEAGRGFAVVANEIKDLAKQTAEASNEIKKRVSEIQSSTEGTATEIINITTIVTEINDIISTIATAVEEQSSTTKEIAENISQASLGISEVNENISQSAVVSQDVSKEILGVTHSSSEMADSSQRVKDKAEALSELAARISEMMQKFKV